MMATTHITHHTTSTTTTPSPWRHRLSLTATLVIGVLGLSACGPTAPDPTDAAQQFADHLATEEFTGLADQPLTDDSMDPAALADTVQQLEQFPLTVHLESAQIDDSDADTVTATANYTVTWDLTRGSDSEEDQQPHDEQPAETWSYPTQAHLVWDAETETWQPYLTASTLVPGLADDGRVDVVVDQAQRGTIRDGDDNALAMDRPVQRIGIDKSHVVQALSQGGAKPTEDDIAATLTESATDLAEALDLDPEAFVERTLAAGERAWVEFIFFID